MESYVKIPVEEYNQLRDIKKLVDDKKYIVCHERFDGQDLIRVYEEEPEPIKLMKREIETCLHELKVIKSHVAEVNKELGFKGRVFPDQVLKALRKRTKKAWWEFWKREEPTFKRKDPSTRVCKCPPSKN